MWFAGVWFGLDLPAVRSMFVRLIVLVGVAYCCFGFLILFCLVGCCALVGLRCCKIVWFWFAGFLVVNGFLYLHCWEFVGCFDLVLLTVALLEFGLWCCC